MTAAVNMYNVTTQRSTSNKLHTPKYFSSYKKLTYAMALHNILLNIINADLHQQHQPTPTLLPTVKLNHMTKD